MSRRRRRGNKLIVRILLISLGAHVIALPILARFGAFDKIKREFVTSTVTVVPPPIVEKEKPVARKAEAKKPVAKAKGPTTASRSAASHNNMPHPAVVASNAPAGAVGGDGPTIDPVGTGKAGVVPSSVPAGQGTGNAAGGSGNSVIPPSPQPEPKPAPTSPATPKVETPPAPKPEPPAPKPHVPVLTSAEPSYQPQPTIPDDLRAEALDKTCIVEIRVGVDGSAENVKVSQSSGVDELDQLAIASAKKWRFKAATRDGEPIAGVVRLHVQFKVD